MEARSFDRLMSGKTAQMVITDPPFNLPIDGHVSGLGRTQHREFVMGSGEMSKPEFIKFLVTVFGHLVIYSADGAIHFVFMDWRHLPEILTAGEVAYSEFKQLCIWVKSNAGMGSFYRSQHELVLAFKSGKAAHINNFQLGQHGRHRSNVWRYPGINTFRKGRLEELEMHPTVKPVALIADAIKDCSTRGGIVLDCFAGSGTVLTAAETTGRRAYAMELDPVYVDTAIRRWQAFTGEDAIHGETSQTFAELADLRTAEAEDGSPNSAEQPTTTRPDNVG
jgi:16S rRNA G966 N2-methylase RsmD